MIPRAFGDEFGIITPTDPPDDAHAQLCTAMLEDSGYMLVADELVLITSAHTREDGFCEWSLHRCDYAGAA